MNEECPRLSREETMEERLGILELIEAGKISASEGVRRLEAMEEGAGESKRSEQSRPPSAPIPRPALVRKVQQIVFWIGVAALACGGLLVSAVHTWEIASGWQVLGWALLILGVLVTLLGSWLRYARWLFLRVRERDGVKLSLAFPLPLSLAAWGLRIARPFAPQLRETGVDELVLAMQQEISDGSPLVVEVNDEEDGEHVRVYLG